MRILKIKMVNLASFEGEQVIDFTCEPLCSSGLFTIVGPTGSGKSTCLDALSLALYGTSPRFYGATKLVLYVGRADAPEDMLVPNDPRNILRKGCKECLAEVEFVGQDQHHYVASWMAYAYKTKKPLRTLVDITGNKRWTAQQNRDRANADEVELKERIEQVVGLDYEQFTRTVMLAQNSFAGFLKADGMDKGRLLEKLTGTEIYSRISRKIYELHKEASDKVKALEMEQGAYRQQLMDEEVYEEKLRLRATWLNEQAEWKTEKERWQKKHHWHQRKRELSMLREEAEENCRKARQDWADSADKACRLDKRDAVQDAYVPFLHLTAWRAQLKEEKNTWEKLRNEYAGREKMAEEKQLALNHCHLLLQQLELTQRERLPLLNKYRTLGGEWRQKLAYCGQLEVQVQRTNRDYALLQEAEKECAKRLSVLDESLKELQAVFMVMQQEETLIEKIPSVIEHLRNLEKYSLQKEKISGEKTELEQKILPDLNARWEQMGARNKELDLLLEKQKMQLAEWQPQANSEQTKFLQQKGKELTRILTALDEALTVWSQMEEVYMQGLRIVAKCKALSQEETDWKKKEEEAYGQLRGCQSEWEGMKESYHIATAHDVEALRQNLKAGVPCPVCGASSHPYAEQHGVLKQVLEDMHKALAKKEDTIVRLQQEINRYKEERGRCSGQIHSLQEERLRLLQTFRTLRDRWEAMDLDVCVPWGTWDNREPDWRQVKERMTACRAQAENESAAWQKQWDAHTLLLERCREANARLQQLSQEQSQNEKERNAIHIRLTECMQKKQQSDFLLESVDKEIEEVERKMSVVLSEGWKEEWQSAPSKYCEALEEKRRKYLSVSAELTRKQMEQGKLQVTVKARQEELWQRQKEKDATESLYEQERQAAKRVKQELDDLFHGRTAEEIEQDFARQKAAVTEELERHQLENEALAKLQAQACGQQEQLQAKLRSLEESIRTEEANLQHWLDEYNHRIAPLTAEELHEILTDQTDWETLRKELAVLKTAYDTALGRYKAITAQWTEHLKESPEETDEQIVQILADKERLADEREGKLGELGVKISMHEKAQRQIALREADYHAALELCSRWKQLNTVFGTADGNRYREKAQCFTLAILVEHANAQLRLLTSRYALAQIPDSLGLKIVDHDRGDEERSVSTLSGGDISGQSGIGTRTQCLVLPENVDWHAFHRRGVRHVGCTQLIGRH